ERVAQMHQDELVTVLNPHDALEVLRNEPIDLFITDIHLGYEEMDGLDFTAYLRENGLEIPIIAITAYDYEDYRRRSKEVGTDYHIVKPVAINDLVDLIDQFR
ncbi:MAG: hypothetical protein CUN55_02035, partial [Phototrophicales bacterium]